MVILTSNVRTKAGLMPAGADVTGKLSDEVIADLIKSGLARETKNQPSEKVNSDANDIGNDEQTESEQEPKQSDAETTEQDEKVEESADAEDSVDLKLPDTSKPTGTRGRGRRGKAKS